MVLRRIAVSKLNLIFMDKQAHQSPK